MIFAITATFAQKNPFLRNNGSITVPTKITIPFTIKKKEPEKSPNTSISFLSPDFYSSQLGFFCRQEIKIEKAVKVAFKFRLGSVAACDYLEGKNR